MLVILILIGVCIWAIWRHLPKSVPDSPSNHLKQLERAFISTYKQLRKIDPKNSYVSIWDELFTRCEGFAPPEYQTAKNYLEGQGWWLTRDNQEGYAMVNGTHKIYPGRTPDGICCKGCPRLYKSMMWGGSRDCLELKPNTTREDIAAFVKGR